MADIAEGLDSEHGPAAYRALGGTVQATGDEVDEALRQAELHQRAVTEGLVRLARLMRARENCDSVVRWFKSLRDAEYDIIN